MEQQLQIKDQKFAPIIENEAYKGFWRAFGWSALLVWGISYSAALSYAPWAVLCWTVPIVTAIFLVLRPYKNLGFRDYISVIFLSGATPFLAGYLAAINTYKIVEFSSKRVYFKTDFATSQAVLENYFNNRIVLDFLVHGLPIVGGSLLVVGVVFYFVRRFMLMRTLRAVGLDESRLSLSTESNFDDSYVNPLSDEIAPTPMPDAEAYDVEASLLRIAGASKKCYDQFELVDDEIIVIYFENTDGYVDSFMEVTSYDGVVTNLVTGFAIPPNEENDSWTAYRISLENPEVGEKTVNVKEIDQEGIESELGLEYYEWLADCLEEIMFLPTVEKQPVQRAPVIMYWHS